jgi:hypothetical protein
MRQIGLAVVLAVSLVLTCSQLAHSRRGRFTELVS